MKLNDEQLMILVGINKHKSYREMAEDIGRSLRTVQVRIVELMNEGYIEENGSHMARSRTLTTNGKELLKKLTLL